MDIDESTFVSFANAIEQTEVQSEDSLKIGATVGIDGDRHVVRLDDEVYVIDVTEGMG